ncbi:kinase-like domain-containing protein [Xylaria sp. CBS 124048]|nr:kinase-like domain-containing protein [Xylaria sp. CBS 124048]
MSSSSTPSSTYLNCSQPAPVARKSSSSTRPNPDANPSLSSDMPLPANSSSAVFPTLTPTPRYTPPTATVTGPTVPTVPTGPTTPTAPTSRPIIPTPTATATATATTNTAPRPIPSSSNQAVRPGISDLNRSILDLAIGLIIPSTKQAASPSHSPFNVSPYSTSLPTPVDSLRWPPRYSATPIPEGCDEETCSESLSNDPVTPVSSRQSRDFQFCDSHDFYHRDPVSNSLTGAPLGTPEHADASLTQGPKEISQLSLSQSVPSRSLPTAFTSKRDLLIVPAHDAVANPDQTFSTTPAITRPSSAKRRSTLTRAMSSLFRRSYHPEEHRAAGATPAMPIPKRSSDSTGTSETNLAVFSKTNSRRRFSYHRSTTTTRSNSPPSPPTLAQDANGSPTAGDFLSNSPKKHRALTGLSLRHRVNFVAAVKNNPPRRARTLERKENPEEQDELARQPWAIPPDAGTGMKARRLSLSLPDDFTVDVAELQKEYEYHHLLGRHGKHLGKGATAKVSLMVRKGYPGELYAVKEFRPKSSSETPEDYVTKIKSEFSIAKSLHHPNVVETIQLCTKSGRWNHVMEYCSEGDLFSLVSKKYLREEGRDVDRVCIFKQLCQGINYLHQHGIAHRDIKLENLLITKDSKLKITDFGVSEVFSGIHPGLREAGGQCGVAMGEVRFCQPGICGSMPYIAPEVIKKEHDYDPRALDVWSSAIVMIYLIFGANLWEKATDDGTGAGQNNYNALVAGWKKTDAKKAANPEDAKDAYPRLPAFDLFVKPLPLRRLLLNMLHPDPEKRITMKEVISYRWMKNAECCQLESYDEPTKLIDASKKESMKSTNGKIFCHNHLPPLSTGHGLPPMPGKPGY